MDRFTHDRLENDAILRAQHRASLRKPSHTLPGDPRRDANPRLGADGPNIRASTVGLGPAIRSATGSGGK
jgi:hypothetical protein